MKTKIIVSVVLTCTISGALFAALGDIVGAVASVPARAVEATADVTRAAVEAPARVLAPEPVIYEEVTPVVEAQEIEEPITQAGPVMATETAPVYKEIAPEQELATEEAMVPEEPLSPSEDESVTGE